jgi:hypothetical protein
MNDRRVVSFNAAASRLISEALSSLKAFRVLIQLLHASR